MENLAICSGIFELCKKTERPVFLKRKSPHEKDKIKVITKKFEKDGVKYGEFGEIFLVSHKNKKVFAVFFDRLGYVCSGQTLAFEDFVVTEPFDDFSALLSLL